MRNSIAKFLRPLKAIRGERAGNVMVLFALLVVPVVGAVGVGVDYSRGNSIKSAMQSALDATALTLIKTAANVSSGDLSTQATKLFQVNFNRPEAQNVLITTTFDSNSKALTLSGTATVPTTFLSVLGQSTLNITSQSRSALGGSTTWPVCVLVTDPDSNHTLLVKNLSRIDFYDCLVQVNTQNWDAVEARDTSYIHSTNGVNCFTGDIHYGDVTPPKQPTCTMFPDPYASGYAMPASATTCDYTNKVSKTAGAVLTPGTYCGGLTIQADTTLSPGLYIMNAGDFNVSGSGSDVTAKGVTILLTGKGAGVTINTTGTVTFTPADSSTAGVFAGFAFFLDQSKTGYLSASQIAQAKLNVSGVVYLKGQQLVLDKKATVTINPGSIIAGFILPDNGSSLILNGTANTATVVEQAMRKPIQNNRPILLPNQS
jgi:Flp pilus assembly protein TadG